VARQLEERIHLTILLLQLLNRQRLHDALRRHRREFSAFLQAIRARTGGKQEDLFQKIDFKVLFTAFPVWLANLADIHDVLPLQKELFDLAIIDEATQCDIASSLPILQRAKRIVITGDPNQLRHLSFLSKDRQAALLGKYEVPMDTAELYDYREKSILDFVNAKLTSQDQVIFLNEHYRSEPPIIAFSNETFYGGALHIMTEKPERNEHHSLTLHRVNALLQRRVV
jgi:superfamily I DNA and/or RNA helicase